VVTAALAAGLAACTGHNASLGTVKGVADGECLGRLGPLPPPLSSAEKAFLGTSVYAQRAGKVVAVRAVKSLASRGRYRLSLPPGRYQISAPQSGLRPRTVVLHSGETITVNFTNICLL